MLQPSAIDHNLKILEKVCARKIVFDDVKYATVLPPKQIGRETLLWVKTNRLSFEAKKGSITAILGESGVGKTTSTNLIAACLKHKKYRVLCIDFDQQGHLSFSMGADTRQSPSIYDVIRRSVKCSAAIQKTDVTDIIPATEMLKSLEREFTNAGNERLLRDAIRPVRSMYDYILIDSPPELGLLSANALVASDVVLVPCLPDGYSLKGAVQVHETISRVKYAFNKHLTIGGIFLVRYYPRENLSRSAFGALSQMTERLNIPLLNTRVRHSNMLSDVTSARQLDAVKTCPRVTAVMDYKQLVDELFERKVL